MKLINEKALESPGPFCFFVVNRSLTPQLSVPANLLPLVDGFLDWARVERGFSAETIGTYQRSVYRFFTEGHVRSVREISLDEVMRVKRQLLNRGCSPAYVAMIVLSLRSLLIYCRTVLKMRVLDPTLVTPPKRPRRQVVYLTPDEVRRFTSSIKIENQWLGRKRMRVVNQKGLLYRALVELLLGSGMRISEALSLKRHSIDWVLKEARIIGKGNKERTIFFTPLALKWLKRYLAHRRDRSEYLFVEDSSGEPVDREAAVKWFRRHSAVTGLNKTVTAHVLRHTVATTLMFNGAPLGHIKEILGHERLDTTCRYYLGLDVRRAKDAHAKYLVYNSPDESSPL